MRNEGINSLSVIAKKLVSAISVIYMRTSEITSTAAETAV
jgi:hypothetical protein